LRWQNDRKAYVASMTITDQQIEALRPLLQLIYKGEGTYESVNRGRAGDTPDGKLGAITDLTLAEVMQLQRDKTVFAVGAPQFIPATLGGVVAESKADVSAKFGPATQDRLAAWLILGRKRPPLRDYLRGRKGATLQAAVDALAYEWASLPGWNGRGMYDGDSAGNRAHGSLEEVKQTLEEVRQRLAAPGPSKPAPAPVAPPVLYQIRAVHDTWLKKTTAAAASLSDEQKVLVRAGHEFGVVEHCELAQHGHTQVTLSHGAGQWFIFDAHWAHPGTTGKPATTIDWSDFSCQVTEYLTVGEILRYDHRRRPAPNSRVIPALLRMAHQHRVIREANGGPLGVTSFYRPEPINQQVGGVPNSWHVHGGAMDVYPVRGHTLQWLFDHLRTRWTGGLGDGRDRGFLHLDEQSGGRYVPSGGVRPARAIWRY
jgi:hypothetical protein